MYRVTPHLVQGCHSRHVDPVNINLQANSPQHHHHHILLALLHAVVEDELVRKPDSLLPRMMASEKACPPRHVLVLVAMLSLSVAD